MRRIGWRNGVAWRLPKIEELERRNLLTGSMYVGTNLDGIVDWGATSFVDMMDEARAWDTRNADGSGAWSSGLRQFLPVDAAGWPVEVPFDPATGDPLQVVHSIVPVRGAGTYKVFAQGTGTVRFVADQGLLDPTSPYSRNVTIELTGGAQEFDLQIHDSVYGDGFGEIFFILEASSQADPVRFDVVAPGHGATYADQPFSPVYTDDLADFALLRFMDWGRTNNNQIVSWDQRTLETSYSQASPYGASIEYMVALANQQHQDAWINVPAHADDRYVRNMATYVRDTLDPQLKVFVEYSNETWNTIFEQTNYVQDQGQTLGLDADRWRAGQKYTTLRSAKVWTIFEQQFGDTAESRLVKVLASHAANVNTTQMRMDALFDPSINPAGVMPDALAIAPYFGTTVGYDIVSEGLVDTITVDEVLDRSLEDLRTTVRQWVSNHLAIADEYGLWLATYEGGQHLTGNTSNQALTDLLIGANRSPRMYDLYFEYLDMLRDGGVLLHSNFNFVAEPSAFGSWGIQEYPGQPLAEAHKLRAILDWIGQNPPTNIAPTARAGTDIATIAGSDEVQLIQLDGTASRDFDGAIVDYLWEHEGELLGTSANLDIVLPIGEYSIQLTVSDTEGATSTDAVNVTVRPKAASQTLLVADFVGISPGLSLPWTGYSTLFPHVVYGGWHLGNGFVGTEFHDGLSFHGIFDGTETDLDYAIANDNYLSTTFSAHAGYELDLRGADFQFAIDRIDGHAPRRYVVKSSTDSFDQILFDSGRLTTLEPTTLDFQLPFDFPITEAIEFRVYAFEARYAKHDASLVGFELRGATGGPVDMSLQGATFVDEGSSYEITLSATSSDPDLNVAYWIVDWGDGTQYEVFEDGSRTHIFVDDGVFEIRAYAVDANSTWQAFDVRKVVVENVPPMVTLDGPDLIDEGSTYELLMGDATDPGDDGVTEYQVNWGDGSPIEMHSTGQTLSHFYVDDGEYTISVDLIDEDGTHAAAASKVLFANNVAPQVTATGADTSLEGETYALSLEDVIDPGDDTVGGYRIDWGDGSPVESITASLGEHTYSDEGNYAITVDIQDEDGIHPAGVVTSVEVLNVAPVIESLSADAGRSEGSPMTLVAEVVDPGLSDALTYAWDFGDGETLVGLDLDSQSHTYADDGDYTVTLWVNNGVTDSQIATSIVHVENVAPSVALTGADASAEGSLYSISLHDVSDPGDDLVSELQIDWGDGSPVEAWLTTGIYEHTYADDGEYTILVSLVDEDGIHSAAASKLVTVTNITPTMTVSGPDVMDEGSSYTLVPSEITDPGTDTVTEFVVNWGDGSLPETFAATDPLVHVFGDDGEYTISVDLIDEDGTHENVAESSTTVVNVLPEILGLTGDQQGDEGAPLNFLAEAMDPGTTDLLIYDWDFGDGTSVSIEGNPEAMHTFSVDGNYTVTVRVRDEWGSSPASELNVVISDVVPEVAISGPSAIAEGSSYPLTISVLGGGFSDLRINWGDGSPVDSVASSGTYFHDFVQDAHYTISVELFNEGQPLAYATTSVEVLNVAPVIESLSADAGGLEGSPMTLVAEVVDPGLSDALTYAWDFGDGETLVGLDLDSQSHTYADDGDYTVTLWVNDGVTDSQIATSIVHVENVAPSVALTGADASAEGSLYSISLHDVSDPGDDLVSELQIDWGDGSPVEAWLTTGIYEHTYADDGEYTILVSLVDEDGIHSAAASKLVTVTNITPTMTVSGPDVMDEGSSYTLVPSEITDPGTDTVTEFVVNWGDGSLPETFAATDPLVHVFGDDGEYTISVDLIDEDGTHENVAESSTTVVNVAPSIAVGGPDWISKCTLYSLSLGAIYDPGDDLATSLIVDWGDGSAVEDIGLAALAEHVYVDPGEYTIIVDVVDEDGTHGGAGNKVISVQEVSTPTTLVHSDLLVTGAALSQPYTATQLLDPNVAWNGWSLGAGLLGSNFDGFSFYGDYPPTESDLAHAIDNDLYLTATLGSAPGYELDLASALFQFEVTRIQAHAPRNYAIFTSVAGWSADAILFESGRLASRDPESLEFSLPDDPTYDSIENIELRIFAYGGRYFGHDSSLTDFVLEGTVRPALGPVAPIITSPAEASVPEGTTAVMNVTATDPNSSPGPISFSITGAGADDALFAIVEDQLEFHGAPDFESPSDAGSAPGDNVYEVEIKATDGEGESSLQTIFVTVTPVNEHAPSLTVLTWEVEENTLVVGDLLASDDDLPSETLTYTITGNGAGTTINSQWLRAFYHSWRHPISRHPRTREASPQTTSMR